MDTRTSPAPLLIFTYGNPSRGDDALGPAMFDLLEACKRETGQLADVDLLTDFQLQIEHAVDLENRRCVLFIDAGMACREPFELHRLQAERDDSFTTHAMSPAAVMAVYQQIHQREPPRAYLLTIRAYEFGLGRAMSEAAGHNLQKAYRYVIGGKWLDSIPRG
ncbi:MAG TPA: hydrogenase maturation protease [Xanthomonadales bacterium]